MDEGDMSPAELEMTTTSQNGEPPSNDDLSSDNDDSNDSEFNHGHDATDDLNVLQAASLLTADILGTGLLALPQDIKVLGKPVGLCFLVLNLPLNWFAGLILSRAATTVEHPEKGDGLVQTNDSETESGDGLVRVVVDKKKSSYTSVRATENDASDQATIEETKQVPDDKISPNHVDTHDFIGMTEALFYRHPMATRLVSAIFYTNIFLVLGDYILVMSHAVAALVVDLCIPHAGLVASTLMLALSQLRTMAKLGRSVTITSLVCLTIVVIQCLVAGERQEVYQPPSDASFLRQLSSMASIAFATGSNKLLLNIRREMKKREDSPKSLAISSVVFGGVYVSISVLAGPNPPSFLFDSIPSGPLRRIAGLLLWIHVAVSYAINSQAICASLERRYFSDTRLGSRQRWLILTLGLSISSYLVANVVPFFKDLVALIGALTSIPLTLLLPVILYRRAQEMSLWRLSCNTWASSGLLVFGTVLLFGGLAGTVGSIVLDWESGGRPFSCTL